MIKLNVSAANIAVEEKETLTEGRVGLLCQFRFTDEWAGLAKTAVFDGADSRDVILKSDMVAIPAECLSTEGYSLSVGVYGKNAAGDIVIPTVYATVGKIQRSAYPSGKETAAPTPDVVAQIQQAAANAEAMARSVRDDADLGRFAGPAGEAGGYYTPAVTQPDENTMRVAFTPSKESMPDVEPTDIALPAGEGGGGSGEDGGYYAPEVDADGNLTWTASKESMPAVDGANIMGPQGAGGKSAYAYAVEGGYTGTETAFAAKLAQDKFANPYALTFTGAVTGSYDGSEAVTVEIPGGGGGGVTGFRRVVDTTLTEAAETVNLTTDINGNAFSLSECYLIIAAACTEAGSITYIPNGYWVAGTYIVSGQKTATDYPYYFTAYACGGSDHFFGFELKHRTGTSMAFYNSDKSAHWHPITSYKLAGKFAAGARFIIIGRDA